MAHLNYGVYERLFDEELRDLLEARPELRSIFGKIEADEEPSRFAAFLTNVLEKAFKLQDGSAARLELCNAIIERVAGVSSGESLLKHRLVARRDQLLEEITPPHYLNRGIPRPETPLSMSILLPRGQTRPMWFISAAATRNKMRHAEDPTPSARHQSTPRFRM